MSVARIKSDFKELPIEDKIRLAQDLWDEIGDHEAALALTPEQEAEFDARYQRYTENPGSAIPLAEALARYERRK